jgi:hypothetical protein
LLGAPAELIRLLAAALPFGTANGLFDRIQFTLRLIHLLRAWAWTSIHHPLRHLVKLVCLPAQPVGQLLSLLRPGPQLVGQFSHSHRGNQTGTDRQLRLRRHDHSRRRTALATLIGLCRRNKSKNDNQTYRCNNLSTSHVDNLPFFSHAQS